MFSAKLLGIVPSLRTSILPTHFNFSTHIESAGTLNEEDLRIPSRENVEVVVLHDRRSEPGPSQMDGYGWIENFRIVVLAANLNQRASDL